LETGRERKLTARVVLVVANSDEKIIDPKYHNCRIGPSCSAELISGPRFQNWIASPLF
jgi:hypothetical protein